MSQKTNLQNIKTRHFVASTKQNIQNSIPKEQSSFQQKKRQPILMSKQQQNNENLLTQSKFSNQKSKRHTKKQTKNQKIKQEVERKLENVNSGGNCSQMQELEFKLEQTSQTNVHDIVVDQRDHIGLNCKIKNKQHDAEALHHKHQSIGQQPYIPYDLLTLKSKIKNIWSTIC